MKILLILIVPVFLLAADKSDAIIKINTTDPRYCQMLYVKKANVFARITPDSLEVKASDGTGHGDDGDLIYVSTAGGASKYTIVHDHSAGAAY